MDLLVQCAAVVVIVTLMVFGLAFTVGMWWEFFWKERAPLAIQVIAVPFILSLDFLFVAGAWRITNGFRF